MSSTYVHRAPHSGLSSAPFWHFFKTFPLSSTRLPHGFVAFAWLLHGFLVIRVIPDSFRISYMLVRRRHLMSLALSACFPECFQNIREAVRNVEASRIGCGICGSIEDRRDVLTLSARQCRQSAESVTKFISASKFCFGPKSWHGKFALQSLFLQWFVNLIGAFTFFLILFFKVNCGL